MDLEPGGLETTPAPFVTVHVSVSVPTAPAVNWMAFDVAPCVMVPPLMLQEYVAPACDGTLAAICVTPVVTLPGAVMVASGGT
jgi:hypothetical protein